MEESEFNDESAAGNEGFERIEERIQGNEELFALARRTAGLLANCPPEKRAIILQEAQSLWDNQRVVQSPDASPQDDGTFLDVTSAWMSAILHDLPVGIRIEVLQILSQLRENARFDRLAIDLDLDAGE